MPTSSCSATGIDGGSSGWARCSRPGPASTCRFPPGVSTCGSMPATVGSSPSDLAREGGALVSPGDFYGAGGAQNVRAAVVQPDDRIEQVARATGGVVMSFQPQVPMRQPAPAASPAPPPPPVTPAKGKRRKGLIMLGLILSGRRDRGWRGRSSAKGMSNYEDGGEVPGPRSGRAAPRRWCSTSRPPSPSTSRRRASSANSVATARPAAARTAIPATSFPRSR